VETVAFYVLRAWFVEGEAAEHGPMTEAVMRDLLRQHPNEAWRYHEEGLECAASTAMWLDRMTTAWDWHSMGTGRDRERLWWANQPAVSLWRTTTLPAPTRNAWYRVDVTDLVAAWVGGSLPNHGMQLRPTSTSNNFNFFYSADYAVNPTLRPRLVVRY